MLELLAAWRVASTVKPAATTRSRNACAAWLSVRAFDVQQAHLALDVQLLDRHLADRAGLDVLAHAHARQEGDALVVLHQAADGLQRRHLDVHVERHLVALELAQHDVAVRRHARCGR